MAILIWNIGTTVLDDYFTPQKVRNTEPDAGTRHMIVQAASVEDALATVATGESLPGHDHMHCAKGRAKPRVCGKIYECEFDYVGLWAGSKRSIVVTDNLEGWDTGIEIQIVSAGTEALAKGSITVGGSPGEYGSMFYMAVGAEAVVEGHIYKVTAPLKGVSLDKPIKWEVNGYYEKQSQKLAVYPGQTTGVPVESNQALVGVTALWISIGSVPNCAVTGTNVTPTFSPGVPTNIWASIPNPIHVYPYGWIIETRKPDIIPGTAVCFVKDAYVYYQHYKPGNA